MVVLFATAQGHAELASLSQMASSANSSNASTALGRWHNALVVRNDGVDTGGVYTSSQAVGGNVLKADGPREFGCVQRVSVDACARARSPSRSKTKKASRSGGSFMAGIKESKRFAADPPNELIMGRLFSRHYYPEGRLIRWFSPSELAQHNKRHANHPNHLKTLS